MSEQESVLLNRKERAWLFNGLHVHCTMVERVEIVSLECKTCVRVHIIASVPSKRSQCEFAIQLIQFIFEIYQSTENWNTNPTKWHHLYV